MENINLEGATDNFVIYAHREHNGPLVLESNLVLENSSAIFGTVTIANGNVTLGNYAFIRELCMLTGGEIFFSGKKPFIRTLRGTNLTVHIPKKCMRWTDFVQNNYARNVTVVRDI